MSIEVGSKEVGQVYTEATASTSQLGSAISSGEYEAIQQAFQNNTRKGFELLGKRIFDKRADFLGGIIDTNPALVQALRSGASFFGGDGNPGYMSMRLQDQRDPAHGAHRAAEMRNALGLEAGKLTDQRPLPQNVVAGARELRANAVAATKEVGLDGFEEQRYFKSNVDREIASPKGQELIRTLREAGYPNAEQMLRDLIVKN